MGYSVIQDGKRYCIVCAELKELSEFGSFRYTTKQGKPSSRYSSRCKICELERSRLKPRKTEKKWSDFRRNPPQPSAAHLKVCNCCSEEKPRIEYYPNSRALDGLQYDCKKCRNTANGKYQSQNKHKTKVWAKKAHLKIKYGITLEEWSALLVKHDHSCAVCKSTKVLCVDHNHQTGKVRGILCRHCNASLGLLKEDMQRILGLASYLKESANL